MASAKTVADAFPLVTNNHNTTGTAVFSNPYFKMYGDNSQSGYSEVLFWRQYSADKSVGHYNATLKLYEAAVAVLPVVVEAQPEAEKTAEAKPGKRSRRHHEGDEAETRAEATEGQQAEATQEEVKAEESAKTQE